MAPPIILQNRYEIIRSLGKGGFGSVYEARDMRLDKRVAVKEVLEKHQYDDRVIRRFEREAKLLSQLRHSTLPDVTDYFTEHNTAYLVMEYIAGEELNEYLKRQPHQRCTEAEALKIISPILDAVEYLHTRPPPVIHRDIKPHNIRITTDGSVFLVDFGLAKIFDAENAGETTMVATSGPYSPPEQFSGKNDMRSDLYSLGATLYRMLAGEPPLMALERHGGDKLVPLRNLNPGVSGQIEHIITRLLAMNPSKRYQSVAELRHDLAQQPESSTTVIDDPPAPRPPSPTMPRPATTQRWLIGGAVMAMTLLALVVALWLGQSPPPSDPTATPSAVVATQPSETANTQLQPEVTAISPTEVFTGALPITLTVTGVQPQYAYTGLIFLKRTDVFTKYDDSAQELQVEVMPHTPLWSHPNVSRAEIDAARSSYYALGKRKSYSVFLSRDDEVEILDTTQPGWYQVRIRQIANEDQKNKTGWVKRWLVDNKDPPPKPQECKDIPPSEGQVEFYPSNCVPEDVELVILARDFQPLEPISISFAGTSEPITTLEAEADGSVAYSHPSVPFEDSLKIEFKGANGRVLSDAFRIMGSTQP